MTKTYHFMAGLPRSGSTVLSALLNQNPEIYASPQTDLLSMLYELESKIPSYESYRAKLMHPNFASVLYGMADTFYTPIDKPVVIDKNRGWGTPYNWDNLSLYVNPEGKVILTMRPILEVLASFIRIAQKTNKATASMPYLNDNLWATHYRNATDAQVESIMAANGEMDRAIFSIANLINNHRDKVHVVWFDDLLDRPQETMNGIYDFLGLNLFEHNFNNIKSVDNHDDFSGYGVLGLHDVGKKLTKPKTKVEDYLSDYAVTKYGNALDFLNL
jgi:sulfotransferase